MITVNIHRITEVKAKHVKSDNYNITTLDIIDDSGGEETIFLTTKNQVELLKKAIRKIKVKELPEEEEK